MKPRVTISTLTDGGQRSQDIAAAIAAFVDGARSRLELAQSTSTCTPPRPRWWVTPSGGRRREGSRIRFAYNVDHDMPIPVPPPASPDQKLIDALPSRPCRSPACPT